jgi:hypothetical protein
VARAEVPAAAQENTMKAIAYDKYGSPDVLEFRDVSKGRPAARWAPGCTELNPMLLTCGLLGMRLSPMANLLVRA